QPRQPSGIAPTAARSSKPVRACNPRVGQFDSGAAPLARDHAIPVTRSMHHEKQDLTRSAVSATVHCLTGCAIGEVLGMVVATALGWGDVASILVSVLLAFVCGLGLPLRPVRRAVLPFRQAARVAVASDTVSIATMEIVDN